MRTRLHWLWLVAIALLASAAPAFADAKRTFAPVELARMGGDWARMSRDGFFSKYKMNPTLFARLRRETGAFPNKTRGIQPDEVAALKEDYFLVVAGLRKESQVLADHGVTYTVTDTLRDKPEHALDFPKSKGRELRADPKLPTKVVDDWAKVRSEELPLSTFRKRYPKVRAGELAAMQDLARSRVDVGSGTKGVKAASVMELTTEDVARARALGMPTAKIPEQKLRKLRAEWGRVERKEISQMRLCLELGIPTHQLMIYKQTHPTEFLMPDAGMNEEEVARLEQRWPEVQRGEISMGKLLREENVSLARFNRHREDHEGSFATLGKGRFERANAGGVAAFDDEQLDAMKALYGQFHRAELSQAQLEQRLRAYGVTSPAAREHLRSLDDEAFSSREDFLGRHFDEIVDDLVRLAKDHRFVVHRWQDFTELAESDPTLKQKWGPLRVSSQKGWLVLRDRRGAHKLQDALAEIGVGIGKGEAAREAAAARRGQVEEAPAASVKPSSPPRGERAEAQALSELLEGTEPSKERLLEILEETIPGKSRAELWKKWIYLRRHLGAQYPELARWDVDDRHDPYSLRYVARFAQSMHDAGPNASYEQVLGLFKQSREYAEDGREPLNNDEQHTISEMAKRYPELVMTRGPRARFQKTRRLLELLRTAPKGDNLYDLKEALAAIGYSSLSTVYKTLEGIDAAGAARLGFDWKMVSELRKKRVGLGQKNDPSFDANLEPPGIDLKLARDILDTPRRPPLLDFALQRLAKRKGTARPFATHNVMFINHRYSDLVPFAETMIAAGMAPKNSVFVSTPYPFSDAVSYQLRKLGIDTYVPKQDMDSMAQQVERGIRKMLDTYDDQAKRWTAPHPILILDDGGMAAKIIAKKFPEHYKKFRVVEITAAGERVAQDLVREHGRLPFVYYSIAYSEAKKQITSEFFATRVVQKLFGLLPQTGLHLNNQRAAVRGGGPMGLFAAKRLRDEQHMDVTIIEPDATKAKQCIDAGFKVEAPEDALPGRGLVLGMSGYPMDQALMKYIDDGAVMAQGSSKRQEFPMDHIEKSSTSRKELPRTDGLPQKSYTYLYKPAKGKARRLHVLGDGWTLNHDGALAGTPIEDIQLELSLVFESAVEAADTSRTETGKFRIVGKDVQELYVQRWKELKAAGTASP